MKGAVKVWLVSRAFSSSSEATESQFRCWKVKYPGTRREKKNGEDLNIVALISESEEIERKRNREGEIYDKIYDAFHVCPLSIQQLKTPIDFVLLSLVGRRKEGSSPS